MVSMHPSWVQIAVKARRSPAAGRVTTIWYSGKILPPPTGMSDVGVSAGAVPPGAVGAAGAPGVGLAAGGAVDPLPLPQAVSAAAHSALLAEFMREIREGIAESRHESLQQPHRPPRSLAQHHRIAEAIRAQDAVAAAAAMKEHLDTVSRVRLLSWNPEN